MVYTMNDGYTLYVDHLEGDKPVLDRARVGSRGILKKLEDITLKKLD